MMMEADVDRGDPEEGFPMQEEFEEEQPTRWVLAAMRRQNRMFGVATMAVLVCLAVLFLTGAYSSTSSELPGVGNYDADTGIVSNDADNAKSQAEALLDKLHENQGNWFSQHPGSSGGLTPKQKEAMKAWMQQVLANHTRGNHTKGNHSAALDQLISKWSKMNGTHAFPGLGGEGGKFPRHPGPQNDGSHGMLPHDTHAEDSTTDGQKPVSDGDEVQVLATDDESTKSEAQVLATDDESTKSGSDGDYAQPVETDDESTKSDSDGDDSQPVETDDGSTKSNSDGDDAQPVETDDGSTKSNSDGDDAQALETDDESMESDSGGDAALEKEIDESTESSSDGDVSPAKSVDSDSAQTGDTNENVRTNETDWLSATVTKQHGVMYEVLEQLPHDPKAFTEGLTYANGILYESTGMNGRSTVRKVDPKTGRVMSSAKMPSKYFGEGLTYHHGMLFQLTYKKQVGFIYNASDLQQPPRTFQYTTTTHEGWGLTYNPSKHELIVTDGSRNLMFWDADSFETLRTLPVTRIDGKTPAVRINEVEWWRDRIISNVWYEDVLLVINPDTGIVEKEYDFSTLWPREKRPLGTDCFNGISISEDPDVLFVTGKNWNRMYRLKLLT